MFCCVLGKNESRRKFFLKRIGEELEMKIGTLHDLNCFNSDISKPDKFKKVCFKKPVEFQVKKTKICSLLV